MKPSVDGFKLGFIAFNPTYGSNRGSTSKVRQSPSVKLSSARAIDVGLSLWAIHARIQDSGTGHELTHNDFASADLLYRLDLAVFDVEHIVDDRNTEISCIVSIRVTLNNADGHAVNVGNFAVWPSSLPNRGTGAG